ncbi:alpha/beta hydrolase [Rhizobium sp. XQZ8]|uniref:alpha/beta hydrolase n=1 Tax=Rhizobium populisoli TaxID=2859785 RepID=UPI001C667D84|nr:alpha/beta hydrolase [Rhizobium populisoli]MBW6425165.1 alpha/beta hydrolase [Rhizobium populisoli]
MIDVVELSAELSGETLTLMERVAAELGPLSDPTTLPSAEGRAQSLAANVRNNVNLPEMENVAEVFVAEDAVLGSARCRVKVLVPAGVGEGAILFVHGGGFAFCSPETHERCARVLALEAGLPVVLPHYRLAPENPYPAGLKDVVATLRSLFEVTAGAGVRPGLLLMSGDSAGANLALATMLHEQAEGRALPDAGLLFYGNYARSFDTPSYERFADGPGLTRGKMQRYWSFYAGGRAIEDDLLACPLAASDAALAALPPLYLMAAAVDPLLSDTLTLSQRLRALGRDDELNVVPGVVHGFLQNTNELSAAREALAAAGKAARQLTRRP